MAGKKNDETVNEEDTEFIGTINSHLLGIPHCPAILGDWNEE